LVFAAASEVPPSKKATATAISADFAMLSLQTGPSRKEHMTGQGSFPE
jgi:hypothetical protein